MDVAAGDGQEQGWKQLPLKKREQRTVVSVQCFCCRY